MGRYLKQILNSAQTVSLNRSTKNGARFKIVEQLDDYVGSRIIDDQRKEKEVEEHIEEVEPEVLSKRRLVLPPWREHLQNKKQQ